MAKNDFQYKDGILTPCNLARSRHWFRQVTAPCNVACGSGIVTVNSPSGNTYPAMWYVALTWPSCHWIRPNVRHIGILYLVSIFTHHRSQHVILYQSAKFYPNRTTLGREKWRHVDFQDGVSQPSWIAVAKAVRCSISLQIYFEI